MKSLPNYYLLIVITILFSACNNKSETNFLEGKVKREIISIAPKVPGRISQILVNEGSTAKTGDTMAIIDIPEVIAKQLQAEGSLLAAKAQYDMALRGATQEQVRQVVAMHTATSEQFQFAQKSLDRIRNMYNDSLVTPQKYDEAMTKYNAAKAQLEAAEAKKQEVVGGVRDEKIKMAEGQMKRAEGALQEANVAYSERYIIAPRDMTIETIALHEGELALPGYNIFIGYRIGEVYFRFTVRESKLNNYKKDTKYKAKLPFANLEIECELTTILQLANYANKTSSYPKYQLGESVYELKFIPKNKAEADKLYNNQTVIIELSPENTD